jgi:hypothetical protein
VGRYDLTLPRLRHKLRWFLFLRLRRGVRKSAAILVLLRVVCLALLLGAHRLTSPQWRAIVFVSDATVGAPFPCASKLFVPDVPVFLAAKLHALLGDRPGGRWVLAVIGRPKVFRFERCSVLIALLWLCAAVR